MQVAIHANGPSAMRSAGTPAHGRVVLHIRLQETPLVATKNFVITCQQCLDLYIHTNNLHWWYNESVWATIGANGSVHRRFCNPHQHQCPFLWQVLIACKTTQQKYGERESSFSGSFFSKCFTPAELNNKTTNASFCCLDAKPLSTMSFLSNSRDMGSFFHGHILRASAATGRKKCIERKTHTRPDNRRNGALTCPSKYSMPSKTSTLPPSLFDKEHHT